MIRATAGHPFGGKSVQRDLELTIANSSQVWKETPLGRVIMVLLIKGAGFNSTPNSLSAPFPPQTTFRLAWLWELSLSCHSEPVM